MDCVCIIKEGCVRLAYTQQVGQSTGQSTRLSAVKAEKLVASQPGRLGLLACQTGDEGLEDS